MLRQLILNMSRSLWLRRFVLSFPLARKVSRRFVAGETLEDALAAVRQLQAQGLEATLDLLGENVAHPGAADEATQAYLGVLEALERSGLHSHCSLKLTQLGLDQGTAVALANLRRILGKAQELGTFVRIDMESSEYTERTLEVFEAARAEFANVGVVIQAYLKRSKADVAHLNALQGRVRLCKGAYSEPASIAYQGREEVTANMLDLARDLLLGGDYPAIASHDEEVISAVLRMVREHSVAPSAFEFQMLYGIRRDRQAELRREGYNVRIYVPFGSEWYPYLMRRLAERPANLLFFLTALFRG